MMIKQQLFFILLSFFCFYTFLVHRVEYELIIIIIIIIIMVVSNKRHVFFIKKLFVVRYR